MVLSLKPEVIIIIVGSTVAFLIIVITVIVLYYWRKSINNNNFSKRDEEAIPILKASTVPEAIPVQQQSQGSKSQSQSGSGRSSYQTVTPPQKPTNNNRLSTSVKSPSSSSLLATGNAQEEMNLVAQMFIRSVAYSDLTPLLDIGSRSGKFHYLVDKDVNGASSKYIMTMSKLDDSSKVSAENKLSIKRALESIQNPFVMPVYDCDYLKDRHIFVCFKKYCKESLKDLLNKSKPTDRYTRKYTTTSGKPLSEAKIAKFGRQILEGLLFLKSQKVPVFHLTTSNILLDENGVCRLTDFENSLLGLSLNPPLSQVVRTLLDKVDPTVVAFGSVIYEMSVGYSLDSANLDDLPSSVTPKVKKVLQTIFRNETKVELQDLNKLPFFAEVQLYSTWTPQNMKIDTKVEQLLVGLEDSIIQRLRDSGKTKKIAKKQQSTVKTEKPTNQPSVNAPPPAKQPQPTIPPAPAPAAPALSTSADPERGNLLNSIESFNPKKLRKASTKDRSAPKV